MYGQGRQLIRHVCKRGNWGWRRDGFLAGSLTSPEVLAKAMRSRLGDQTRKTISCGSCFSPTTRKDGKQVGKRNMRTVLQRCSGEGRRSTGPLALAQCPACSGTCQSHKPGLRLASGLPRPLPPPSELRGSFRRRCQDVLARGSEWRASRAGRGGAGRGERTRGGAVWAGRASAAGKTVTARVECAMRSLGFAISANRLSGKHREQSLVCMCRSMEPFRVFSFCSEILCCGERDCHRFMIWSKLPIHTLGCLWYLLVVFSPGCTA